MTGDGPAILVVDDNEANRYALVRRLRHEGYDNLAEAEHGRGALDLLARPRFDLVLLDVMMPEMTGYEVLARIQSDARLRDIPVFMVSAGHDLRTVIRRIERGT